MIVKDKGRVWRIVNLGYENFKNRFGNGYKEDNGAMLEALAIFYLVRMGRKMPPELMMGL